MEMPQNSSETKKNVLSYVLPIRATFPEWFKLGYLLPHKYSKVCLTYKVLLFRFHICLTYTKCARHWESACRVRLDLGLISLMVLSV